MLKVPKHFGEEVVTLELKTRWKTLATTHRRGATVVSVLTGSQVLIDCNIFVTTLRSSEPDTPARNIKAPIPAKTVN